MSMGAQLEKDQHNRMVLETDGKSGHLRAEEKMYNIKVWVEHTLSRLEQPAPVRDGPQKSKDSFNHLISLIENALLVTS